MRAWAQNKYTKYQIPSEARYFMRLAMAKAYRQPDEALWLRQRPEWVRDLFTMETADVPAGPDPHIALPDGIRIERDG